MQKKQPSGKKKPAQFTFSLTPDEFSLLLLMAGMATGCMFQQESPKLAYRFVRLANRLNENNPHWSPYAIPSDDELKAEAKAKRRKRKQPVAGSQ